MKVTVRLITAFTIPALTALPGLQVQAQQVLPAPLQTGGPESNVPVAVQLLRWHMLDNEVSPLMFRSMDQLFTTRKVARSGPVWELPRQDHALDFTYTWQEQNHEADEFLER